MATAGFMLVDGVVFKVVRWDARRGTFPNPRVCRFHLQLVGVLLIYCNEASASWQVSGFRAIETGPVRLATDGEMMALKVIVRVSGPLALLRILDWRWHLPNVRSASTNLVDVIDARGR